MLHLTRFSQIAIAVALWAYGCPGQQSFKGRLFVDKTQGYKITLPADWSPRPIHMDAKRLVGWFHSHRRYFGDPEKGDGKKPHRAILQVVRLDKSDANSRSYDYPARLKRELKADSYKSTVAEVEVHGQPARQWDVKVVAKGIDRYRIRALVFPREDHDLAVEFRVLEEPFPSLESTFMRALKSVQLIEANPRARAAPILSKQFELRPWLAKSIIDRHRERAAIGRIFEERVIATLPTGWTVHRTKRIMIVSDCDAKTTKVVEKWVDEFSRWIDDRFGGLSSDYPIRTVIRLCKNDTEYYAYRGSGGWRVDYNFADREVVMCSDRGNFNMKDVLWAVFRRYMLDVAPEVYFNMPVWLAQAVRGMCARAHIRRGKLAFPSDADELGVFDALRRTGRSEIAKPIDLMCDPHFGYVPDKSRMDYDRQLQARVLFRFFDGPGKRCKAVRKDFLLLYCEAIRALARELDFADPAVMVWDSEEAIRTRLEKRAENGKRVEVPDFKTRWVEYLKLLRKRRAAFNKTLHERVCNWSKSEWTQIERAYERFLRSKSR